MLPTIEWENQERKASRLELSFRDQTVEVNDRRKNVIMGRAEDNDLVIKGNLISRIHAKVEMRRGKFILVDQSTNGTFVDGKRVSQHLLEHGDAIRVGDCTITFFGESS